MVRGHLVDLEPTGAAAIVYDPPMAAGPTPKAWFWKANDHAPSRGRAGAG